MSVGINGPAPSERRSPFGHSSGVCAVRTLIGRGVGGVMRDHQKPAKYGQSRLM